MRTNFGSNMEDYVNIRVKSGKVWDENFYAETLPRVIISDAEVAARTELIRKTKGELAYRNNLIPSMQEEGMKHSLDRSRVDFVSKTPGYYTKGSKESAHAQEFMNRELPPNPLQLARLFGTKNGIQGDTPPAPAPSPNGTPAGATPSKTGPKNS